MTMRYLDDLDFYVDNEFSFEGSEDPAILKQKAKSLLEKYDVCIIYSAKFILRGDSDNPGKYDVLPTKGGRILAVGNKETPYAKRLLVHPGDVEPVSIGDDSYKIHMSHFKSSVI